MGKHSLEKTKKENNNHIVNVKDRENNYLNKNNKKKNDNKKTIINSSLHDDTNINSNKNNKKTSHKKIIILLLLLVIIVGLIVAGYLFNKNKKTDETYIAEKSVEEETNNIFEAIKDGNKDEINKYLDYDKLLEAFDESFNDLSVEDKSKISKALFDKIDWKVEKVNISDTNATVNIQVENKNFINVVTNLMKKLVEEKNKGNKIDDELSISKLIETLDETAEMETNTGNINFMKYGENWKLQIDDGFRDLIYPEAANINNVMTNNTKRE